MDKILVIQDNKSINLALKYRLEPEGFVLDISETGEEGIEKAKTDKYRLILLDCNLPGINGLEVCRILKKEEKTKNIPIILISAYDEETLIKTKNAVKADDYINLPFKGKEIIEKISFFLNKDKNI